MPRGIKGSTNYDAEIAKVDEKIERHERNIKQLKATRMALENKKRDFDMRELYSVMNETGTKPGTVISAIKGGVIPTGQEAK